MPWLLFLRILLLGTVGVASASLIPRWENFELQHGWAEVPQGWVLHDAAPADHLLDMSVGLKQDKFDEMVRRLYEVSDPSNARYGAHLSKEEVEQLVAPHPSTTNLVSSWLDHHGFNLSSCHRSPAGDTIKLTVPVRQAEQMLNTKYYVFRDSGSSDYIVRTLNYSLPSALIPHVTLITPTTYFGNIRKIGLTSHTTTGNATVSNPEATKHQARAQINDRAAVSASCPGAISPACLRALYNSSTYVPTATNRNSMGVGGFDGQFANFADLQTFFQQFRTDAVGGNFTVVSINGGGNNQSILSLQANLDVQYAEGMNFPTPTVFFSTTGMPPFVPDSFTRSNTNEPYLDFLNFILNQTSIPQTLSISYSDDEQTVPLDFAFAVCSGFAQLAARGVSVLVTSGNNGVGAGTCLSNDHTNTVKFQPMFPATCPFVTSVGSTMQQNPEFGASFSGGGFSNYFARTSYQATAVTTFLTGLPSQKGGFFQNTGLFNMTGRAYPDVSAQGRSFQVALRGATDTIGGTSIRASAPVFAGIVALLNDFRISLGKSPLGFLNPLLYSAGTAGLNDITVGTNPGCRTPGFSAATGWDPVTGLGTPDFGKLQDIVASLP